MTGIERLRKLAREQEEKSWSSVGKVRGRMMLDIADHIEREITPHERRDEPADDHAADVSVSAYDLLPADERDAIAWVRDHGGLERVKWLLDWCLSHDSKIEQLDFDYWLSGRVMHELGFDEDMADRDEVERRLLARLMPEGMEWLLEVWPRWSNGEYCRFGDWWTADRYGDYEPRQLRRLVIYTPDLLDEWEQGDGESYGYEWDFMRPSELGYRPDKAVAPEPAVLAADNEPLEVGQTVWDVETGEEFHVTGFDDGYVITDSKTFGDTPMTPSALTHERPDSWERMEKDANAAVCAYFGTSVKDCESCDHNSWECSYDKASDLVRRAKALAERERGE